MAKGSKWYVVLKGKVPGIYTDWEECQKQTAGFPKPVFKAYTTKDEATEAWKNKRLRPLSPPALGFAAAVKAVKSGSEESPAKKTFPKPGFVPTASKSLSSVNPKRPAPFNKESWAVDAACSGNPGPMEYRGVDNATGQQIFHLGPLRGTNNIGEFLAIVHALALLKQQGSNRPVYSDSVNAIGWVKQKTARTKLPRTADTESVWVLIDRAVVWLRNNTYTNPILKWETQYWGENPADFGRKG